MCLCECVHVSVCEGGARCCSGMRVAGGGTSAPDPDTLQAGVGGDHWNTDVTALGDKHTDHMHTHQDMHRKQKQKTNVGKDENFSTKLPFNKTVCVCVCVCVCV